MAGAATALALARRGRRDVRVFDPRPPGSGSTGAALGGFRTQHGSALNVGLSLASRAYFEARADRIGFRPNGYLYVAESEDVAAELRRRAELQRGLGLPIEHPAPGSLVPFLKMDDLCGSNFCALDGVYLPTLVLACMTEEAAQLGITFCYEREAGAPDLEGEGVVVAGGVWSPEMGSRLGVRLPVERVERGVFEVGPFDWLADTIPMTLEAGSGYHFRERGGRLLVMGPGDQHEWGHFDDWLRRRAPAAAGREPADHWSGYYEVTFDHHPLVGATEMPGVWAICGFSGHGVMHSPAAGDCLAAMMLGDSPPLDITALSPLRTEPLVDSTQL